MNVPSLKLIAIFSLVLIGGVSTAYAAITITLAGNVIITDNLTVEGTIDSPTLDDLQSQIDNIETGAQGPQGEKGDKGDKGHKGDPGNPLQPCELNGQIKSNSNNSNQEYCFVVGPDTCDNFLTQFNNAKHNNPEPICFEIPQGPQGPQGPPGNDGQQGPPGVIPNQTCPQGQVVIGINSIGELICSDFSNNTAPTITSDGGGSTASVNVVENTTIVTDVQSTDDSDSEGSGLTYSFTTTGGGGEDNGFFTLNSITGLMSFTNAPDFENPLDNDNNNDYEVQVTVTDSGGLTDVQDITVTVTDVVEAPNAAPVIISNGGGATASISLPENLAGVGDVQSIDDSDSEGAGLTYSFTTTGGGGEDNGLFSIFPSLGLISFNAAPDFETPMDNDANNDYEIQVTVTDSGGLTDTQDITVNITDVGEKLLINEIDANQVGADETEFVEIFNGSSGAIDLSTIVISFINGSTGTEYLQVSPTGNLLSNEYLVIVGDQGTGGLAVGGTALVHETGTNSFVQNGGASGDCITLKTTGGTILDSVCYETLVVGHGEGNPAPADPAAGLDSIGRNSSSSDLDDNATDFSVLTPSPGVQN